MKGQGDATINKTNEWDTIEDLQVGGARLSQYWLDNKIDTIEVSWSGKKEETPQSTSKTVDDKTDMA